MPVTLGDTRAKVLGSCCKSYGQVIGVKTRTPINSISCMETVRGASNISPSKLLLTSTSKQTLVGLVFYAAILLSLNCCCLLFIYHYYYDFSFY